MLRRLAGRRAEADVEMNADSAPSPGTGRNVAAGPFWKSLPAPVPTWPRAIDESSDAKPPSLKGRAQFLRMKR